MDIRLLRISILSFVGLLSSVGMAQEFKAKVNKVAINKTKILISTTKRGWLKAGDVVRYNDNCFLEVEKKSPSYVLLKTQLCEKPEVLKKGDVILLSKDVNYSPKKGLSKASAERVSVASNRSKARLDIQYPQPINVVSRGVRVGLVQSLLDVQIDRQGQGQEDLGRLKQDFGIKVGYANIKTLKPGFLIEGQYTQYDSKNKSLKLDLNAAIGLSSKFYGFGGINIQNFSETDLVSLSQNTEPGVGFQLGLGAQFTKEFGLGLSFVRINSQATRVYTDLSTEEVQFRAQGVELNFNGTF